METSDLRRRSAFGPHVDLHAEHGGVAMVVVESDLPPPDPAVVMIPLLPDYPSVSRLNPIIWHDGRDLVLATRLIAAVRRAALRKTGTAAAQGDDIVRAVDVLMGGVLRREPHGARRATLVTITRRRQP